MDALSRVAAPQREPVTDFQLFGLPTHRRVEDALRAHVASEAADDCVYVLYPRAMQAAARAFLEGFPGETMYAVKANPHPAVLDALWDAGVRSFDVASMREVEMIAGRFPGARLYLMHPVKSRQLIRRAYALGVRDFVFDCADELQKIWDETGEARDLHLHLRLALPKGDGPMPLTGKFGAGGAEAVELLRAARPIAASLGVCFHVGSQCLDLDRYGLALGLARRVVEAAGVSIDTLDVGGGYAVAYPGMETRPWSDYFAVLREGVAAHGFGDVKILGEPGRALVAEGGSTVARIELRKGRDLYLNEGAYGSLYDAANCAWKYPVRLLRDRPPAPVANTEDFRFFGPTCDSIDTMEGPFVLPADAAEGDWIEVRNLGAYGQTLSTQFNGFFSEATVIVLETD